MKRVPILLALALSLLGCALPLGPAPVSLPPRGSVEPATLLPGSPRGYSVIWESSTGWWRPGKVWFAQSREELSLLWEENHIPLSAPEIDFAVHLVVAFTYGDLCPEALDAFTLDDRGVLAPRFGSSREHCLEDRSDKVHVVAFARAALPPRVVLELAPRWRSKEPTRFAVALEGPTRAPPAEDGAEPRGPLGALRATLPLPEEGEVLPRFLDDGMPVWLVRHLGGALSVLSAFSDDVPREADAAYTHRLTSWDRRSRRFSTHYDEHGAHVEGWARPGLSRHRAEIASGAACAGIEGAPPRCVRVGELAPSSPRLRVTPRPRGLLPSDELPRRHIDRNEDRGISIEEARRRHQGKVVLLDASMVLEDGKPARLCKVNERAPQDVDLRCPATAPIVVGQKPWSCDACVRIVRGPLFTRVSGDQFRDIADVGAGFSSHPIPGARFAPKPSLRREIGVGPVVSFDAAGVVAGGAEISWGYRRVHQGDRDPTSLATRLLFGNVYGFDLRAQLTHRAEGPGVETTVALGLAGRFAHYHAPGGVRFPSLLGLLAPEVGVLLDSRDPARLYVGVSGPMAFRHEYARFGLEFEPALRFLPETSSFMAVFGLKGLTRW